MLSLALQALNDSGLGAAVIGGGIDDELKQPIFGLGLKGVDPANVDKVGMWMDGEEKGGTGEGSRPLCHPALLKSLIHCRHAKDSPARSSPPQVESLILSQLEALAATGFSASAVEAAVNSIEFSLRENNTGSFPRGLSLMLRAVNAWIYDRDPFQPIQVRRVWGVGRKLPSQPALRSLPAPSPLAPVVGGRADQLQGQAGLRRGRVWPPHPQVHPGQPAQV